MAPIKPELQEPAVLTVSIPITKIPLFLRNKLHPSLPYSLPLYRRCQFFLYQLSLKPQPTESTAECSKPEVWIALSQPASTTSQYSHEDWLDSWLNQPQPRLPPSTQHATNDVINSGSPEVWLSCYIDLHEPGQTQIWTFGSWEPTSSPQPTSSSTTENSTNTPTAQQLTLGRSLFHHLRTNHIPYLSPTPSLQYLTMKAAGKIVSSPYKRSKILFGTIAETTWWLLQVDVIRSRPTSLSSKTTAIAREDRPYLKYIIPLPLPASQSVGDAELVLRPLSPVHLQTVLDRSSIPRSLELLMSLPTVGVFPSASPYNAASVQSSASANARVEPYAGADVHPVSWGILAKDASISSVHTEPTHRGCGLAEVVSRELIRGMGGTFRSDYFEAQARSGDGDGDGDEVAYAHVDISVSNVASRRVFEKMGAKVGWSVGWVEVDVEFDRDHDDEVEVDDAA